MLNIRTEKYNENKVTETDSSCI